MIHIRFARENLIVAREFNSFKARLVCLPDSLAYSYILYICPQEVTQLVETILNEAEALVQISLPFLVQTCQKKKKKSYTYIQIYINLLLKISYINLSMYTRD
jgi:hypothetical protein